MYLLLHVLREPNDRALQQFGERLERSINRAVPQNQFRLRDNAAHNLGHRNSDG